MKILLALIAVDEKKGAIVATAGLVPVPVEGEDTGAVPIGLAELLKVVILGRPLGFSYLLSIKSKLNKEA